MTIDVFFLIIQSIYEAIMVWFLLYQCFKLIVCSLVRGLILSLLRGGYLDSTGYLCQKLRLKILSSMLQVIQAS